jgi:hypothetical protein
LLPTEPPESDDPISANSKVEAEAWVTALAETTTSPAPKVKVRLDRKVVLAVVAAYTLLALMVILVGVLILLRLLFT